MEYINIKIILSLKITPISLRWERISLALAGHSIVFLPGPIKPRHIAESGVEIKAKPFGRFAALTSPPFFRLFVFVADGRECLRRGFRTGIHDEAERQRQFTLCRNTPQISSPEFPLAGLGQEAAWHSAMTFFPSVFFGLRDKTNCPQYQLY